MSFLGGLFSDKQENASTGQQSSTSSSGLSNDVMNYWKSISGQFNPGSWNPVGPNQYQTDAAARQAGYASGLNPAFNQANSIGANGISTTDINRFMSPYTDSVVNATQRDFDVQNARGQASAQANAAKLGALGGTQPQVGRALLAEAQNRVQAPVIANLRNQGFQTAANLAGQSTGLQLQGLGAASNIAGQQSGINQTGFGQGTQFWNQDWSNALQPYNIAQGGASTLATLSPQSGISSSGTSTGTQTSTASPSPFSIFSNLAGLGISAWSDRRIKENVKEIGATFDGQPIYKYNLKGSPKTEIGLMAQDVEKRDPHAVGSVAGIKTVDYDRATEGAEMATGGSVGVKPYGKDNSEPHHKLTRAFHSIKGMLAKASGGAVEQPARKGYMEDVEMPGDAPPASGHTVWGNRERSKANYTDAGGVINADTGWHVGGGLGALAAMGAVKVGDFLGKNMPFPYMLLPIGAGAAGGAYLGHKAHSKAEDYRGRAAAIEDLIARGRGLAPWQQYRDAPPLPEPYADGGEVGTWETTVKPASWTDNIDKQKLGSGLVAMGQKPAQHDNGAMLRDQQAGLTAFMNQHSMRPGYEEGGAVGWGETGPVYEDEGPAMPSYAGAAPVAPSQAPQSASAQFAAAREPTFVEKYLPGLSDGIFAGKQMTPTQRLGSALMAVRGPRFGGPLNGFSEQMLALDKQRLAQAQIDQAADIALGKIRGQPTLAAQNLALEAARNPAHIRQMNASAALNETNADKEFLLRLEKEKQAYAKDLANAAALQKQEAEINMMESSKVISPAEAEQMRQRARQTYQASRGVVADTKKPPTVQPAPHGSYKWAPGSGVTPNGVQ